MLPFKLTVCGISELDDHAKAQVSHVVSILDPTTPEPEAFAAFDEHHRFQMWFHDTIKEAPGFEAPQESHIKSLLAFGQEVLATDKPTHLLVHCHLGISRSTVSLMLLIAQARPQMPALEIADGILRMRPQAWPNLRMATFGDEMLGRKGEFRAAVREVHRRRAEADPSFAHFIKHHDREEEVEGLI